MHDSEWWKDAVIYQIYPLSFQDSNADGRGDLRGIAQRLDYLSWLGVGALWVSPFYPSPMVDFGYDIADYTDVSPLFGTLADFDHLVEQAHARGLRVILDYVPNHSSDRHPWFQASRDARDAPQRDWYLWRDPAPQGGPPNNWLSSFGGSAWEWDAATGQYYYHAYLREQPDLNWRNPAVRDAMHEVLRFWLARGVDGFRVDALWHLIKDAEYRDDPPNPDYTPDQSPYCRLRPIYSGDRPEVHEMIAGMRRVLAEFGPDRLLIGEVYLPLERLVTYYGVDLSGAHLPFNFQLVFSPWSARRIERIIEDYEAALPPGGWPNWVLGNHDRHRLATRVGQAQTRVAAMLLLTLRGTPTIYYGEEIGMQDVAIPPGRVLDPWERNVPGLGLGRDPERTPMQWDCTPHAGFSNAEPWLPVAADYCEHSVARQRQDPRSLLQLYRALLGLRNAEPALRRGAYRLVSAGGEVLAYLRQNGPARYLVALNLGGEPHAERLAELERGAEVVLDTGLRRLGEAVRNPLTLDAHEGLVLRLS